MRLTVVLAHHLIFMGASPAKVRLRKVMFVTTPWHPEQSGMLPIEAPWPSWNTTFSMRTLAVSFLMQTDQQETVVTKALVRSGAEKTVTTESHAGERTLD